MKFRRRLVCLSTAWVLGVPAFSQDEGLETLVEKSRVAMEGNRWEEALDFNTRAVMLNKI